jgi:hypothetical protein
MKTSWIENLVNTRAFEGLYEGEPPLQGFFLQELRLEERGPSIFIVGEMPRFPDFPRASWAQDASVLEVRLSMTLIENFWMKGGAFGVLVDLEVERAEDGFGVILRGEGDDLDFSVAGMSLQVIGMRAHGNEVKP